LIFILLSFSSTLSLHLSLFSFILLFGSLTKVALCSVVKHTQNFESVL
jgi:hypothetical protein